MPFRATGSLTFKGRIHDESGMRYIVTLSTTDEDTAERIEAYGKQLRAERRWDVLRAIIHEKKLTLAEAYDHRHDIEAFLADRQMPDLDKLLEDWKPSVEGTHYYAQARALIKPGERFPVSEFRRARIATFLKALPVGLITRRKYKVALASVAKFLLERELIDVNPVRDIDLGRVKNPKPVIFLPPSDVRTLVEAIANPKYQALEALMAGTGMEKQACKALHRRDVDTDRRLVFARGQKNRYRTRWVEFTEDWAWEIFLRYIRPMTPEAQPFAQVADDWWHEAHREATQLKKLRPTTPHHHRHSFALRWLGHAISNVDDRNVAWLKNQLGHAPQSNVLFTTYAVEIKALQLTAAQENRLTAVHGKRAAGVSRR